MHTHKCKNLGLNFTLDHYIKFGIDLSGYRYRSQKLTEIPDFRGILGANHAKRVLGTSFGVKRKVSNR